MCVRSLQVWQLVQPVLPQHLCQRTRICLRRRRRLVSLMLVAWRYQEGSSSSMHRMAGSKQHASTRVTEIASSLASTASGPRWLVALSGSWQLGSVSVSCAKTKRSIGRWWTRLRGHIEVRQEHRNSVADLEGGVALLQCERDSEALGIRAEPATARG